MVILAGICDVLDGRLARETNQMSKFGALFDSSIDRYSEVLIFLGLSTYFLMRNSYIVLVIIVAIAGSFMVSYTRARAEGLGIQCKVGIMQRQERITYLAAGAILGSIPGTKNLFLMLSLWIIAIFANITVLQRIIYIKKRLEETQGN
jgi:CDP-diacylglycerol--glycerol-3-phosphate 3-phosphatidyltransferase